MIFKKDLTSSLAYKSGERNRTEIICSFMPSGFEGWA
jgi:hypothetical protein